MDVLVVARRARLVGGRPAGLAVVHRPATPVRVDLHLGVAGEDVGDDVRRLAADHALAFDLLLGLRPDLLVLVVQHLEQGGARHLHAAVGDRAVARDHVDGVRLERADAHRQHRRGPRPVLDPEVLVALEDVVEAADQRLLDGRNVERELERRAKADRAALEPVGLDRRELVPEVREDVHEHRGGGHGLVVDADRVVDRLDRRSGLAPAIGEHVELRLEALRTLGGVAGASGVGQDLAGPVIHHRRGRVVDPFAAQREDPRVIVGRDLLAFEERTGGSHALGVRGAAGRVDPLLGLALHLPVERRDDLVATGVDQLAVVGRVGAEVRAELAADLPDEVRGTPGVGGTRREHDALLLGLLVFQGGVAVAGTRAVRLHQLEDVVPPDDDLAVGGDDQLEVLAVLARPPRRCTPARRSS